MLDSGQVKTFWVSFPSLYCGNNNTVAVEMLWGLDIQLQNAYYLEVIWDSNSHHHMHHNYINQLLLCNKYSHNLRTWSINIFFHQAFVGLLGVLYKWSQPAHLCNEESAGLGWEVLLPAGRLANSHWLCISWTPERGMMALMFHIYYFIMVYSVFSFYMISCFILLSNHSFYYSSKFYSIFKTKCQN